MLIRPQPPSRPRRAAMQNDNNDRIAFASRARPVSIMDFSDELLTRIVSYVIEVPDEFYPQGTRAEAIMKLFPAAILRTNYRLRSVGLDTISRACLWLELRTCNCANAHRKRLFPGFTPIPAKFAVLLSTSRPKIHLTTKNRNSDCRQLTSITPFSYHAFMIVVMLMVNIPRDHTGPWTQSFSVSKPHRARVQLEVIPVLDNIAPLANDDRNSIGWWYSRTQRVPRRQLQSPAGSLYHEARFVLQQVTDLVRSEKVQEAAVFLRTYGWFVCLRVRMLFSYPRHRFNAIQALAGSDWETSTHARVHYGLNRIAHEIEQLTWCAFRFLQTQHETAKTRLAAPVVPSTVADEDRWATFGLSHREIAEWHELMAMRNEWQARKLEQEHCGSMPYETRMASLRAFIGAASSYMKYACSLQPSNKKYLHHRMMLRTLLKRLGWGAYEQRSIFLYFMDADEERRVWLAADPDFPMIWNDGDAVYLPRARIITAECREVFDARSIRQVFKDLTNESAEMGWKDWQPPENMESRCSTETSAEPPQR